MLSSMQAMPQYSSDIFSDSGVKGNRFAAQNASGFADDYRPFAVVGLSNMSEPESTLSYATPRPGEIRRPMHCLVVTILASTFIILIGLVALLAFFAVLLDLAGQMYAIVPLGIAVVFLWTGTKSMTCCVRFLRGLPPMENWQQWM